LQPKIRTILVCTELQHFPSLHRTLSHKDSEQIRKGINAVMNDRLNGFDYGFGLGQSPIGSDLALSGWVWIRYAVRARESAGPRHRPAGPRTPRARGEAGWAVSNSARSQFPINKFFFFLNLFYKLQINLNSNQI
jgi:hypothetical protein